MIFQDRSRWDVSSVTDMNGMFLGATVFKRNLCGAAWVNSIARKDSMFEGTTGSISSTVCKMSTSSVFTPESSEELKSAVDEYLKHKENLAATNSSYGPHGPHGPIELWDVSRVTDHE